MPFLICTGNQGYATSSFNVTSQATLQNVPNLVYTVLAGVTYTFEAFLATTSGAAAGGVRAGIGGVVTATAFLCDGIAIDSTAVTQGRSATLGGTVVTNVATVGGPTILLKGYIQVNAGGTLQVQFAQNTSNATQSSVLGGSWFNVMRREN